MNMTNDDELPDDEEEILVYVEFDGLISDNAFGSEQLRLDMIGIDTDHPIMQINGRFYDGTYEDAVGTYMFFEKTNEDPNIDPVFDTPSHLQYVDKTRKVLKMQRVFIENRAEVLGDSEDSRCMPNMDVIQKAGIPVKYQEEALSFWNKLRDYRMDALNSYLEKQKLREERKAKGIPVDSDSDDDNPFAAYDPMEDDETAVETKTPEAQTETEQNNSTNAEEEEKSALSDKEDTAIASASKQNETTETSEATDVPDVNPEQKTSTAIEPEASSKKKASKKKSPSLATKKPKIVHAPVKRKGKKSQAAKSTEETTEDEKVQVTKQSNVEVHEQSEVATIEETEEPDKEQDTEVEELAPAPDKATKEEKREAKIQEILQRLQMLASEQAPQN